MILNLGSEGCRDKGLHGKYWNGAGGCLAALRSPGEARFCSLHDLSFLLLEL